MTHDRWFARSFDRYLVFRSDREVSEVDEPVWDEARVQRASLLAPRAKALKGAFVTRRYAKAPFTPGTACRVR